MSTLIGRPHVFERGDKVYLTTPLTLVRPTDQEIEEYAFASAVKTKAPNENIGWLQGRYVEAGKANLNNAMWLSDELALKALTPMLMPVTVMHDPRTAVGTIADTKLVNGEALNSRIDTVLAIWRHRFSGVWDEAAQNVEKGTMMQSMEAFSPHYSCSECNQTYIKLPNGAERASWCSHLRGDDSSPGRRILGDVCFTGTGLIFGTRGGVGAYTEAYLDHFQDEVAEMHDRSHQDSTYKPTQRSTSRMGVIQIEESELAELRRERNEARDRATALEDEKRTLTTKAETAEAAQKNAEGERDTAQTALTTATETAAKAQRKSVRIGALGTGFMARLGETTKTVLNDLAEKADDAAWELALAEREEMAGVKRDATDPSANGGTTSPATLPAGGSGFGSEEVARFMGGMNGGPGQGGQGGGAAPAPDGATSVRALARSFGKRTPAGAGK